MQKDYWNIAKRNFRILAILLAVFALLVLLTYFGAPAMQQNALLLSLIVLVVTCGVFFYLAHLFKNKSRKAIPIAYTYLAFSLISSIVGNFVMTPPGENTIVKIIGILLQVYLVVNVYKASKQDLPQITQ